MFNLRDVFGRFGNTPAFCWPMKLSAFTSELSNLEEQSFWRYTFNAMYVNSIFLIDFSWLQMLSAN